MKDLMRYLSHNFSRLFSVRKYHTFLSSRGIKNRKKALFSAMSELGINNGITEDEKLVLKEDKFYIDVQPIWLWLIES